MKRVDTREAYYTFSGKLSDITRQLGLAGIALVWVFKADGTGAPTVPSALWCPASLVVLGLALDFLQYVYQTAAWGLYNRSKERSGIGAEDEFAAPDWINWLANAFLWGKVTAIAAAYAGFLSFLWHRVAVGA